MCSFLVTCPGVTSHRYNPFFFVLSFKSLKVVTYLPLSLQVLLLLPCMIDFNSPDYPIIKYFNGQLSLKKQDNDSCVFIIWDPPTVPDIYRCSVFTGFNCVWVAIYMS